MKKRIPFAVCLHHTGVRGVGAKQHAKKEPVFGKKKFHGIRRFHGTQTVDKIKSTVFFYKENRISMSNI